MLPSQLAFAPSRPVEVGEPVSEARQAQERPASSQTLQRGLDLIDVIASHGPASLLVLTEALGLSRSTTHRLAAALVTRGLLTGGRGGYSLGPQILRLADEARGNVSLVKVAEGPIRRLAADSLDTVNLAILDGGVIRYLDQAKGSRRMEIRSVVGETRPVCSTGLGKALILDEPQQTWRDLHRREHADAPVEAQALWLASMADYAARGAAFDREENADKIRCVAAPIRGADGRIVAAISLSSLAQYMDDERMLDLCEPVCATARTISVELGWSGRRSSPAFGKPAAGRLW